MLYVYMCLDLWCILCVQRDALVQGHSRGSQDLICINPTENCGSCTGTPDAAKADTASRFLWYLQSLRWQWRNCHDLGRQNFQYIQWGCSSFFTRIGMEDSGKIVGSGNAAPRLENEKIELVCTLPFQLCCLQLTLQVAGSWVAKELKSEWLT